MSILAAAEAATQPTMGQQLQFTGFFLVVALGIAAAAGVFRRGSIRGPLRLGHGDPRGGLFAVMLLGVFVWLGAQIAIGVTARARHDATGTTQPFSVEQFTAADYALLATIPGIAGILVLLAGDMLVPARMFRGLGLRLRQLLPGLLQAVLAIVILLPVVYFTSVLMEMLYRRIGYQHPGEHDLLRVIRDVANPLQRVALIAGATVIAPVFEEILFRGHLQSLMVSWIGDIARYVRGPAPSIASVDVAMGPVSIPAAEPSGFVAAQAEAEPTERPADTERPLWSLWLGVVITSLLFASIHPAWSAPMIFVLSVGLGYAYERTGNLWVPIGIHLLFNSFNTALFLLLQAQN